MGIAFVRWPCTCAVPSARLVSVPAVALRLCEPRSEPRGHRRTKRPRVVSPLGAAGQCGCCCGGLCPQGGTRTQARGALALALDLLACACVRVIWVRAAAPAPTAWALSPVLLLRFIPALTPAQVLARLFFRARMLHCSAPGAHVVEQFGVSVGAPAWGPWAHHRNRVAAIPFHRPCCKCAWRLIWRERSLIASNGFYALERTREC